MSNNNNTSGGRDANFAGAPHAGRDFEAARNEQVMRISSLSPEAQQKAHTVNEVFENRLNQERNNQQRSRAFREMKAKNQLLEAYVRSDEPRPNDPQSRENDLRIIDERSKEMVREKEAYFLNRIQQERHDTLAHIIEQDKQRGSSHEAPAHGSPAHDQSHDHEQDR